MTLGNAAAAHVPLIVWCLGYRHRVEADPPRWPSATVPDERPRLARG